MKVLVPAMCQQGQVYATFMTSLLSVFEHSVAQKQQAAREIIAQIPNFDANNPEHKKIFDHNMNHHTIDISIYTMTGESLLGRGRNHCAQVALTKGFDKIFFIDADEGFTWDNFRTLATSPYPIAAGLVPLKTYPTPGSFETVLNFLPFNEDEMFFDDSLRTLKSTLRMARAKRSEWIEVAFTGTGFLCMDVAVFAKLAETSPEYIYPDPSSGVSEVHWSFFDGGPIEDHYLSEDWSAMEKARQAGYKIMVNTNVRADHTGPHKFVAG